MKKATKVWITAGALVLLGCIVFVCIMCALQWDFTRLSTTKYETNITEIDETFNNIYISSDSADVTFVLSDDGTCRVVCYEDEKAGHAVTVENNTLTVRVDNRKAWYDYIGFHFGTQKITVYLPKTEYDALSVIGRTGNAEIPRDFSFLRADLSRTTGNIAFYASVSEAVKIETRSGGVRMENTSVGSLAVSATTGTINLSGVTCRGDMTADVSSGQVYLTDIACDSLVSGGSTGDVVLSRVIVRGRLSVERSTGNVSFDGSDAAGIYVKTSTGNVTGRLLTGKIFVTDTSTGQVHVPKTTTGGTCEIKTGTGNITITVP